MSRVDVLERIAYALLGAYVVLAIVLRAMGETEGALVAVGVVIPLSALLTVVGFRRLRVGHDAGVAVRRLPLVMRPRRRLGGKR